MELELLPQLKSSSLSRLTTYDLQLKFMHLILYSKPECHLCEGLQEKLEQILSTHQELSLEVRDITLQEDWWQAYQYEVPVLFLCSDDGRSLPLPRPSPRATVSQIQQMLQKYVNHHEAE